VICTTEEEEDEEGRVKDRLQRSQRVKAESCSKAARSVEKDASLGSETGSVVREIGVEFPLR